MLRNKENAKKITKALVILATVVMTGCGSATSENKSITSEAVQTEKSTSEKGKSVSKKDAISSPDESTSKENSESSNKKNEDSKNEDKENTSDNKQSVDNKADETDSTQSQSTLKQAEPAQSSAVSVKQNTPPASSTTKAQTCKTIHHEAQYETIIHPAETHTFHHDATGHYENQIAGYRTVLYVVCNCGMKFSSNEEYCAHAEPLVLAGDYIHGGSYDTGEYVPYYDDAWVEDTVAYDEEVVDKPEWVETKLVKDAYDESVCQ